jgi:preprotein translocase subunit SecA
VGVLEKLLRVGEKKTLRQLSSIAQQVNAIEDHYTDLTDEQLRGMTEEFRARFAEGETLDSLMAEAFATVREAAVRTLGQRHYDVQIMGGAALHLGNIAEMRTGEGKTLVATLPAYLNAITGNGVHVVTVNDYLAERDAENMGRVHRFLGLEVGAILSSMRPPQRRTAYRADITYGTNNEFGFDYLRDNMAWTKADLVQRGHHFAIVDEVDSILIDEARTPLIISGPTDITTHWYTEFARLAQQMVVNADYEIDEKKKTVSIGEGAIERVEDQLGIDNLYDTAHSQLVSYLSNAVKAKELFKLDKDYVVMNGEVMIVDEHTGRILAGRRYSNGLHQALEAKEKVEVKAENQTLATITLQNYFRLYDKLSGMTGTAMTEAAEFSQIYQLGVVPIPTNQPMIRDDAADLVYRTAKAKFDAVVEDIVEVHANGQPILVGTTSVEKSEYLSQQLRRRGVKHEVLNAKHHEREASIVAMAGRKGAVTVATNMAGRGTDIMLGGNSEFLAAEMLERQGLSPVEQPQEYESAWPDTLRQAQEAVAAEHDEVTSLGGLYVLGTERHESRRIDNQLRGRSGRQGDPGLSRFYLSLEDDLMRLFKADIVDSFLRRFNVPDDVPIEAGMVTKAIASAQTQREAQNFEIRKDVLKYDDVLNRQRLVIYEERRRVLEGEDMEQQVRGFIDDTVSGYVASAVAEGYPEDWDLEELWAVLHRLYPVGATIEAAIDEAGGERTDLNRELLAQIMRDDAAAAYDRREAEVGEPVLREVERKVILSVLDRKWREHLLEMDYLRNGIGLRAMAQRDPLVEYQREGYDLFNGMMDAIKEEVAGLVFSVQLQQPAAPVAGIASALGTPAAGALAQAVAATVAEGGAAATAAGTAAGAAPSGDGRTEPDQSAEPPTEAPEPAPSDEAVQVTIAGLGPQRPARLQYSAPTETGEVVARAEEFEGEVEVDPNASRAERRRAQRANRKRR